MWRPGVVAGCLVLAACTAAPPAAEVSRAQEGPAVVAPSAAEAARDSVQASDVVDLRVYFRSGTGRDAFLTPVVREVPLDADLPRAALDLLLAGPGAADGAVRAPLPATTKVTGFRVDGDTAYVDLSPEIIADAASVGASPEHEALALAAVANTLTEFPTIAQVRLTVDGVADGRRAGLDIGRFWGGWGLPERLVRDPSVVGPITDDGGLVDLGRFSRASQTLGSREASPVSVTSVRARQRTTYLRLTVELADATGDAAPAGPPPTRASLRGGDVVLEIDGVVEYAADMAVGQRLDLQDPAFNAVGVERTDLPGTVRIMVSPVESDEFYLHTLTSPTRVVLDVRNA